MRYFTAALAALLVPTGAAADITRTRVENIAQRTPATVTVTAGDTLADLAGGWPGGWTRAAAVNDLDDPDLIVAGQVLRIPRRDGARWVPPRPTQGASRSWTSSSTGSASDASSSSSSSSGSSSVGSSSGSDVWHRLAQCESGGNWSINTGNGYYGGLQFSLSSWRAVGGAGYPHQASVATQIAMGQRLQARQGWGAWPACSRKLGLS